MDTFQIVRQEHLNHYQKLFGGYMLLWVDEFAWIAAARDFAGCTLVTRSMSEIDFSCPVENGSILRFNILPDTIGKTSAVYSVKVYSDEPGADREKLVFSNHVSFVNIGKDGKPSRLPLLCRPLLSEQQCQEP